MSPTPFRMAMLWLLPPAVAAALVPIAAMTRPAPVRAASCARPATGVAEMNAAQIEGIGFSDSFRTDVLPDGRWMSVTGDTVRPGEVYPLYDNSVVIWDRQGQRRVGGGNFFPRWPDGSEFWPYQWSARPGTIGATTVYVTGSRQQVPVGAPWIAQGAYLAEVTVPRCGTPTFVRYLSTPGSGRGDDAVQWYGGITRSDGWFYLHGVLDRPDRYHARDAGYVARAVDPSGPWRYWTGTTWSSSPNDAIPTLPLLPGICGGTEISYTVNRFAAGWTIVSKCNGTLHNQVGRYTSTSPTGPWSWTPLLTICDLGCYLTGAAPIPTRSGNIMIQWSQVNAMPVWAEVPR